MTPQGADPGRRVLRADFAICHHHLLRYESVRSKPNRHSTRKMHLCPDGAGFVLAVVTNKAVPGIEVYDGTFLALCRRHGELDDHFHGFVH